MAADPTLRTAIGVIGAHDTCGYPTTGYHCASTATARGIGKPLWESELGAMDANAGADDMVRAINNGYSQARVTGYLQWPLIDSMPPGLPYENRGLVTADQPWSGHYAVNLMTWAIAQTTQFVRPGWDHVGGADGRLTAGGTYNGYESADRSAWSMVTETTTASAPQDITVRVTGPSAGRVVHVWATKLAAARPSDWFVRWADVVPSRGRFHFTLPPGYVVSFTTTTGQGKGTAAVPRSAAMALPYQGLSEFRRAAVPVGEMPRLLAPQDGAFVYAPCADRSGLECVQQLASGTPVWWEPHIGIPYAVLGDSSLTSYTVAAEVSFTARGQTAGLIGRFRNQAGAIAPENFDGYELQMSQSGAWAIVRNTHSNGPQDLARGHGGAFAPRTWHRLSLTMSGPTISASIDGHPTVSVIDATTTGGPAGIMTGGFYDVQFRNLTIVSASPPLG
jgi:hypothetical protein